MERINIHTLGEVDQEQQHWLTVAVTAMNEQEYRSAAIGNIDTAFVAIMANEGVDEGNIGRICLLLNRIYINLN